MFKEQLKQHYGNGNGWAIIFRIAEIVVPLYLTLFFTMYGDMKELRGKLDQLCTRTEAIAASLDKHIQAYDIHVEHKAR